MNNLKVTIEKTPKEIMKVTGIRDTLMLKFDNGYMGIIDNPSTILKKKIAIALENNRRISFDLTGESGSPIRRLMIDNKEIMFKK